MADEKDDKTKEAVKEATVPPVTVDTEEDPAKAHWGEGGEYYINAQGKRVRVPVKKEKE